ncbi:MAG TPA: TIGR03435 family protein [Terracidiphilus sp.]|nr:TIGR03435 family protein [Terracidiphilus sp.]
MIRQIAWAALFLSASGILAQAPAPNPNPAAHPSPVARPSFDAFEVATVKPVYPDANASRYITMQGLNRFVGKNYTLKLLIAAAYDLNPRTILGGPTWIESDHYDILAVTPGEVRPTRDEQMSMLRNLLADRFNLTFHREPKEFSIYVLEAAKSGPKLKPSTAQPDDPAKLISTVYPQHILLPARNTTMGEFASLLQRAVLDRPVVDKTGLSGRYDFDLKWAPDETQFGGEVPVASAEAPAAPLFSAIQEQLGLRLSATKGPVNALVVDKAERPSAD